MPKPYISEVTLFLNGLRAKDPTLADRQRAGRALLWDKRVDRDQQQEFATGKISQRPYVYSVDGPKKDSASES